MGTIEKIARKHTVANLYTTVTVNDKQVSIDTDNNNNNNNNNNNLICIAPACAKKTSVALVTLNDLERMFSEDTVQYCWSYGLSALVQLHLWLLVAKYCTS